MMFDAFIDALIDDARQVLAREERIPLTLILEREGHSLLTALVPRLPAHLPRRQGYYLVGQRLGETLEETSVRQLCLITSMNRGTRVGNERPEDLSSQGRHDGLWISLWDATTGEQITRLFEIVGAGPTLDLLRCPEEDSAVLAQWFAEILAGLRAGQHRHMQAGQLFRPDGDPFQVGVPYLWAEILPQDLEDLLYLYLEGHHVCVLFAPHLTPAERAAICRQRLDLGLMLLDGVLFFCLSCGTASWVARYHWNLNRNPLDRVPPLEEAPGKPAPLLLLLVETASGGLIVGRRELALPASFAIALAEALRFQASDPCEPTDFLERVARIDEQFPLLPDIMAQIQARCVIEPDNEQP